MSRLLWQLLEWLVPDTSSFEDADNRSSFQHDIWTRRRGASNPSKSQFHRGTQSLINSPERNIHHRESKDKQLRRSVSFSSDGFQCRKDVAPLSDECSPPQNVLTESKDTSVVCPPELLAEEDESKQIVLSLKKKKGLESGDQDSVTMASSRRRSLPGNQGEPGSFSRFSFHRRFSMQGARRTAAARRRFHLPYNDIIRTESARICENGIQEEESPVATVPCTQDQIPLHKRGLAYSRRRPMKTRSDYSLHQEERNTSDTNSSVACNNSRGFVDMSSSLLTLDSQNFMNGEASEDLEEAWSSSSVSSGSAVGMAPGCHYLCESSLILEALGDEGISAASTLGRSGDEAAVALPVTPSSTSASSAFSSMVGGPHSSLRSNLKHKGQIRRKRSDSGHSVTFDLPEDCDNLGGSRDRICDETEPLTKCMKEQTNRLKLNVKRERNGDQEHTAEEEKRAGSPIYYDCDAFHENVSNGFPDRAESQRVNSLGSCDNDDLWHQNGGDDEREPRDQHQTYTWHQSQFHLVNDSSDENVGIDYQNGGAHLAEHERRAPVTSERMREEYARPLEPGTFHTEDGPYLPLPPLAAPHPPSPIPPHLLASLAWSSGESECSPGSSTREPDSGYWGTGDGAVVAGKKGVKVVTHGKEYYLPYAYLHQGRLKLRIVRGTTSFMLQYVVGMATNL
ncbi:hypothetical protein SK128_020138 [Halocaridina rubra]|uniref:Uncharacterized protein n=1 Tax=Halocaridina rubra TaxID=373956 RepID=A0AAN8ZNC6_HALRR